MSDAKIKIEICCGTACYMLGASELLRLEELAPENWKPYLDISAIPCMNACEKEALGRAPFIRVDGELIGNASLDKVFEILSRKMLEKGVTNE